MSLRTLALYPRTLDDLFGEVHLIGRIFDRAATADSIARFLRDRIAEVQRLTAGRTGSDVQRVYYVRTDLLTTLGRGLQTELIALCGGRNVAASMGTPGQSLLVSYELLRKWDPEVIILRDRASIRPEDVMQDPLLADVSAVRTGRVFQESPGWTEFRLETAFGLMEKTKWLHPQRASSLDPQAQWNAFVHMLGRLRR